MTRVTHPSPARSAARWAGPSMALLLAVAGSLWASWRVGVPGMWHDEVATLVAIQRSPGSFIEMIRQVDLVHAAYYVTQAAWAQVAGISALALRLPSAVAIGLASGTTFLIGRRVWGFGAGLVAGLALLAIPRSSWAAGEARSAAITMLAVSLVVLCFVAALQAGTRGWWVALGVSVTAATLLFVYAALLIPVLAVALLANRPTRRDVTRFAVTTGCALVAIVPFGLAVASQRGQVSWIQLTTLEHRAQLLEGPLQVAATDPAFVWYAVPLVVGTVAVLARALRRPLEPQDRTDSPDSTPLTGPAIAVLLLGWAFAPGLALLIAGTRVPLFYPRYLVVSTPALALLMAAPWALGRLGAIVSAATVAALFVPAWQALQADREPLSKDVLPLVAQTLAAQRRPHDGLWFADPPPRMPDRTGRILGHVYPDLLAESVDLTLDADHQHSGSLWESWLPLAETAERVAEVDRVVGLAYHPEWPAGRLDPDLAWLGKQGFTEVSRTDEGLWRVLVLERR